MRFHRAKTTGPVFDHTSYNADFERGDLRVHASFHVKHSWADRGFWFGLRPEVEVRYATDRVREMREWARQARREAVCTRCGRREYGRPGLRLPEGWDFIHRMDFCGECVSGYSYRELLNFGGSNDR